MIELPTPGGPDSALGWRTILADPPWKFGNQATRGATEPYYKNMPTPEICLIPVDEIVAESAHLYLWVTAAHLADGLAVMRAWGFTYKQYLVWAKITASGSLKMGTGNYWRHCTELVLFGTRGKAPVLAHDELNLFWAPLGEHSEKPAVLHERIERVSPGPYLEMFAREARPGWTVWGDEAP
jgi:N6-adenosine-specific RNA methylase IME4